MLRKKKKQAADWDDIFTIRITDFYPKHKNSCNLIIKDTISMNFKKWAETET